MQVVPVAYVVVNHSEDNLCNPKFLQIHFYKSLTVCVENVPVSRSDFDSRPNLQNGLGDSFYGLGDRKNSRPNSRTPFGHEKRALRRPLSSYALQRYNKTRRNANRPRRAQSGKIRKKGKCGRHSGAMSIDVALSTCRGACRDAYSVSPCCRSAVSVTRVEMRLCSDPTDRAAELYRALRYTPMPFRRYYIQPSNPPPEKNL